MSPAPALCMWNFWRGCVSFLICWVCVCAFVHVYVYTEKEMRVDCSVASCKTVADVQRCPLCLYPHWGAWIASLSDLSHFNRLLHAHTFLFSLTHTHTHTRIYSAAHAQTYSSWPLYRHLPQGQILTLLSVNSTHCLQETEAGQHFTPSGQDTHTHTAHTHILKTGIVFITAGHFQDAM